MTALIALAWPVSWVLIGFLYRDQDPYSKHWAHSMALFAGPLAVAATLLVICVKVLFAFGERLARRGG